MLAHISTEYYTRLEQGRAPRPSSEVLAGIATALRLTAPESAHLHDLAGAVRRTTTAHDRTVRPSVVTLIDRLQGTVGIVLSAAYEILAWNDLAVALVGDLQAMSPPNRSLARHAFLPEVTHRTRTDVTDLAELRHHVVAQLRTATARYPEDPAIRALVAELNERSTDFATLWRGHDVRPEPVLTKTFRHDEVGEITVDCDTLLLPDRDQHLVLFTAEPGSRDARNLELLHMITAGALVAR
ncbi:Helix-turn-helix domain-containing protein [Actinosynnema pretiosum]|nr:Helix-turn-helix domain-containing protein [Actinosynnema pretiosum]